VFALATFLCRNANAQSDTFVLHSWETHPPPLSTNWAVDEDNPDSSWAAGTRKEASVGLSFVSLSRLLIECVLTLAARCRTTELYDAVATCSYL